MSSKTWFLLASILLTSMPTLFAQTSESELQLGIEAFKENQYEKAINHFDKAVELNSTNTRAHMYLATAYLSQYIPGVDTDENRSQAEGAILHYRQVLDLSTDRDQRLNAANGIAYIYLNMKNWDEARKYYQMASDIAPNDPEPYYSIGVIDWSRCYQPRMEARARLGMQPDQNLSVENAEQKKLCDELRAENSSVIEDGISMLDKAIQLRLDYDDAMAYMNLMYRERADLQCADPVARSRDLKTADDWVDKAMAAKQAKAKAQAEAVKANSQQHTKAPNPR